MLRIITESGDVLIRYDPDQPRDDHGRFGEGSGGGDKPADRYGNVREDGNWFDADGIYMSDSYVEQYGLPVTHAGFGTGAGGDGRYSVVLSERGDIHVMWERDDGGPTGDALYSRDAREVGIEGMGPDAARDLSDYIRDTSEASAVGVSQTNESTGVTLASAPDGAVIVSGLGEDRGEVELDAAVAAEFSDALDQIADAADDYDGGLWQTRYDPDQPRDESGRFGEGSGNSGGTTSSDRGSSSPARGRDLTSGGRATTEAKGVNKAGAKATDPATGVGPRGDERLRAICERQGFDGPPTVVSKDEMDRLVESGHIEVFRGVADHVDSGRTGAELAEEYRSGDLHYGNGVFGNGTYSTTDVASADEYARHGWKNEESSGQPGETMRMALSPDARIVDYGELQDEHNEYLRGVYAEAPAPSLNFFGFPNWEEVPSDPRSEAYTDIGRFAAARGYDAVRIPAGAVAGGEGHYQYNILNRTAVVVQE